MIRLAAERTADDGHVGSGNRTPDSADTGAAVVRISSTAFDGGLRPPPPTRPPVREPGAPRGVGARTETHHGEDAVRETMVGVFHVAGTAPAGRPRATRVIAPPAGNGWARDHARPDKPATGDSTRPIRTKSSTRGERGGVTITSEGRQRAGATAWRRQMLPGVVQAITSGPLGQVRSRRRSRRFGGGSPACVWRTRSEIWPRPRLCCA